MVYNSYGRKYDLTPNRINKAIADILEQFRTNALDNVGKNLLISAERTLGASEKDVISALQPSPEETPCVRVFGGQRIYNIQPVSFVRLDGAYKIPIYFVYYSQGDEDFEDFREAHIDMCMRWLEEPNDDLPNVGMDRSGWTDWGFQIKAWQCVIDHDTPLKYLKNITIQAPYFCSRVDVVVQVNQIGAENDE